MKTYITKKSIWNQICFEKRNRSFGENQDEKYVKISPYLVLYGSHHINRLLRGHIAKCERFYKHATQ